MDDALREEARAPDVPVPASADVTGASSLMHQLSLENPVSSNWFFLKNLGTNVEFYPSAKRLLSKKMKKGKLSAINFTRVVSNLCMIETGFVPLTRKKVPMCSIQELLSLTLEQRMVKLVDSLMKYFEDHSKKLDTVYYTYIRLKDKNAEQNQLSPATSRIQDVPSVEEIDNFEYSGEPYSFVMWYTGEKTFVALKGKDFSESLEINNNSIWCTNLKNKDMLTVDNLKSDFLIQNFLSLVKRSICYVFLDKFNAVGTEYQGFQKLPDEIVEGLTRFLDARTMVNFSLTCRRMSRILDNDSTWKVQCERIPTDFLQYGYEPPSESTLRARLTEDSHSYKEKYKALYSQARSDFRQAHQRRQFMVIDHYDVLFVRGRRRF